jgi:cysteine synthase
MKSRRFMRLPERSRHGIVTVSTSTLIGAETGIKTIAALHSQCRRWVKSDGLAMSTLRPVFANKGRRSGHSGSAAAAHQLRNRQNKPSFIVVLVPKAVEFFLDPPADVPPA